MGYLKRTLVWLLAVIFLALTSCAGDGQFAGQFTIDDIEKLWNSTKGKDQPYVYNLTPATPTLQNQ